MKGFVNIYKPSGMTSSDVVVKVRGILRRATGEKQKTGHLGTLDPLATGVLPIAVGNATRLFDYMQKKTKVYIAAFKFGETTDTLDRGGVVTCVDGKTVNSKDIELVLTDLVGEIDQLPPQYSAKSIGGRRAYDIAREGGIAELKPKTVSIRSIEILSLPETEIAIQNERYTLGHNEFAFRIVCGSGTYIRAIARDMAALMNTVGYMTSLCRVQSGDFFIESSVAIDAFESEPLKYLMPIDTALKDYDNLILDGADGERALNGVPVKCEKEYNQPFMVNVAGQIVGIGETKDGYMRIKTRL